VGVGADDVLGGAGGLRWCITHILVMAEGGLPQPAALAVAQASASAMGCCRGGWPICARCLVTAVDNTSHWRVDVQGQANIKKSVAVQYKTCRRLQSSPSS
jgi:hypothetical protein